MHDKFLNPYSPLETEDRIYEGWLKSGYFNPDNLPARHKEPFSIVLPPPNVTGILHMGSALMIAIEDIMVRYARMQGKKTLWIPGTDHAAIATQSKVEKEIQKAEGKSRHDLGREELLKRIDAFAKESHDHIVHQIRKLGASVDWSREAFTLDEERNLAVRTVFKKMYDDGLIYRGYRVVNWDPKGQTTISDDEIVYEERKAKMYTFKYSKDFPISISTTRPETKVGDVAVAVHPTDERYKQYIGKEYDAVFAGAPIHIKIVADEKVEKEFGTGALGVTPAHSMVDYEIAQRHKLEIKPVINEYAKLTVSDFAGKKTSEARELIVEWIRSQGLLEKEEEITQNISTAERTGGIVEPLPKLQWFIDVNKKFRDGKSLKDLMLKAGEKIEILPDRYKKVYFHWIENLRDWCISRQIWYGHRIPAWCDISDPKNENGILHYKNGPIFDFLNGTNDSLLTNLNQEALEKNQPLPMWAVMGDTRIINFAMAKLLKERLNFTWDDIKKNALPYFHNLPDESLIIEKDTVHKQDSSFIQDPDTLDTWFSSGLWTFSTLGWPDKFDKQYHPTTIIETGTDILFFWVARMIMMSEYILGEIPFKTVYLHGLVRDEKGRKISKSLGNNIDPVDMAKKYGADATRMSLIVGVGPGNDSKIGEDKIKGYRNFSNKLWNITRFIYTNCSSTEKLNERDQKIMDDFDALLKEITKEMDEYKFYLVAEKLYHYVWHEFADKIIEESKPLISEASRQSLLLQIHRKILVALHPFMPFITEEIWSTNEKSPLIIEPWVI